MNAALRTHSNAYKSHLRPAVAVCVDLGEFKRPPSIWSVSHHYQWSAELKTIPGLKVDFVFLFLKERCRPRAF